MDEYNRPCGLGVIYSSTESFFGNYFEGSLESYGRMVFSNGEIYHGELSAGVIHGQGVYYTPGTNVSAVTQTDDGGEHFKVEAAGYVLIDIAPQLGVECDNSNSGIKGNAVTKICEGLERYYARFFVESHTQPKPVIN